MARIDSPEFDCIINNRSVTRIIPEQVAFLQLTSCYATIGGIYLPACRVSRGLLGELSRFISRGRSLRRPLLFPVNVPYMQYFSTAYRHELVAVFKVNCFPILSCFASFLLDIIFLPALPSRNVYSLLLHL